MATTEIEVMATRLANALIRAFGRHGRVESLRRLTGGASHETWSFTWSDGTHHHPLILRRDARGQGVHLPLSKEAELLKAMRAHEVPVAPTVLALEAVDELGEGYVMQQVDGETIPRRILRDDRFAAARPRLAEQCGRILARIHATPLETLPLLDHPPPGSHPAEREIERYRQVLDRLGSPEPGLELSLRWLDRHRPPLEKLTLVHGDFRNGNLIVAPEGIRAVLDWELAHVGDPIEDLGWLCVRSWRFGVDGNDAGGFGTREQLCRAYQHAGGGPVDPRALAYWELFGNVKWGVICRLQAATWFHGGKRNVEMAAIGRRACEAEYDALGLLGEALGLDLPAATPGTAGPEKEDAVDQPPCGELLSAVRDFLRDEVVPASDGRIAYHARVAGNVLAILARELEHGPQALEQEGAGLRHLLGSKAGFDGLRRHLARTIRSGEMDDRMAEVWSHAYRTATHRLRIANPRHLHPKPTA